MACPRCTEITPAVRLEPASRAAPSTVSFGRDTSHGSGRLSQWSGCSTWEPSRISWRKIP